MHYYGHEAGFLRIAEMRQKAAAERRAREASERSHLHLDDIEHPVRWARRLFSRAA
ncbi:MAG: hypothetical protein ACRDP3_14910 [Streptomyces sp.]|uniref:hypothetical protein n=1 Tax=Streptomyces sp. TaxID=1931 RepID=UPI003D6AEDE8